MLMAGGGFCLWVYVFVAFQALGNNMSNTPETDEECRLMTLDCDDSCVEIYIKRGAKNVDGDFVLGDFARKLERERGLTKDSLTQLIAALKELEQQYTKDGRAFLKLANVPEGSQPKDSMPEMNGLIYSSGTYQVCAKGIRDLLKKFKLYD